MEKKTPEQCQKLMMGELVTAIICGYIIYSLGIVDLPSPDLRLVIPGAVLVIIILQGAFYWLYRKHSAEEKTLPVARRSILLIFKTFKTINPVLIALFPIYALILLITDRREFLSLFTLFGVLLTLFSIYEYFNYYFFNFRAGRGQGLPPSDLADELSKLNDRGET